MKKFKGGQKVMIDHVVLQKRPDGKQGLGGTLCLYGKKRLTCKIISISQDFVIAKPEGMIWTVKAKKSEVMEYDPNNDTLPGTGNSMYDNGPIDLDNE